MKNLWNKMRQLSQMLLAGTPDGLPDYGKMARMLSEQLEANVYMLNGKGDVLGYGLGHDDPCLHHDQDMRSLQCISPASLRKLSALKQSAMNLELGEDCAISAGEICPNHTHISVTPIFGAGERLGTLLFCRPKSAFTDADMVLAEYSATVVGMELMSLRSQRREEDIRLQALSQMAVQSLSYSEVKAVELVIGALKEDKGVLVTSRIADKAGITRSVVVNAMRKLESAGVIQTRSLGMKGTHIQVCSPYLSEALKQRSL